MQHNDNKNEKQERLMDHIAKLIMSGNKNSDRNKAEIISACAQFFMVEENELVLSTKFASSLERHFREDEKNYERHADQFNKHFVMLSDMIENVIRMIKPEMDSDSRHRVMMVLPAFIGHGENENLRVAPDIIRFVREDLARGNLYNSDNYRKCISNVDKILDELDKHMKFVSAMKPEMSEAELSQVKQQYASYLVQDQKGGVHLPSKSDELIRELLDKKILLDRAHAKQYLSQYNKIKMEFTKPGVYEAYKQAAVQADKEQYSGFAYVDLDRKRPRSNAVSRSNAVLFQPANAKKAPADAKKASADSKQAAHSQTKPSHTKK